MSSMPSANRRVILAARPTGIAQAADFRIDSVPVAPPAAGQIVVRNRFLSVEPAMRGWIADTRGYAEPVAIGAVMRALAAGTVIASRDSAFAEGDDVMGWFGWQEIATVDASAVIRKVTERDLPLSASLGVLGINGLTAYLALTRIGAPQPGETLVVSTAAGAVGSAVGQIANIMGCRTIGITGNARKVALCREGFGYAAAFDYTCDDLDSCLAGACPDGADIYFDNTAGRISDIVHRHLALRARVVVCGTAAVADWSVWPAGPRVERHLLVRRARMEGFVIFDHMSSFDAAVTQLGDWVRDGRLRYVEEVLSGIEACPDALAGLYRGENDGKRVISLG